MRVLSSLRSRIFLASALLAVLSIGVAIYLVSVRAAREAEDGLQREMEAARALVGELRAARLETSTLMARVIADAPTLKAAVDTNDPPTVLERLQAIARGYQSALGSHLLLVTNRDGVVLAAEGLAIHAALIEASRPAIREATAGRESVQLLPQPSGILQLVTVPILIGVTNPDILGTLSVGILLDGTLAAQLKEATGSEIAFGMDGRIVASTLADGDHDMLADLFRRAGQTADANGTVRTDAYVAAPLALGPAEPGGAPVALILRSRTEQLRFLRVIHTELAATAALAMLLALVLSFAVARTITRPLAAITDAMRDVAATGDLTRKIEIKAGGRWDDEDARLLAATFNALTDSVARFQQQVSQKERLSSLGRLSTVIAHEVRNPLMIIKTALHRLRQPEAGPAAVREAAADIDEEVGRLNRIVNEVLDFARPIRFERAPTDLTALCRESAAAAEAAPGAAVRLDLDPALPPMTTDGERLRIALVNLIVNARQSAAAAAQQEAALAGSAGPARAAEPCVFLSTRGNGDHVAIVVADTGVGIAPGDVAHVFDPYFTTKRGGTGLGLPIARNIIEGLGGTLTIASAPGRGTEIRVELPLGHPVG
jgi:signal transduction histidine kinase